MNTYSSTEELELVRRATHSDHEAFRCLVLSYEPQLLVYLLRLLGDWEDACDIAQETFIAAYYALPHWKPTEQTDASNREEVIGTAISLRQKDREVRPLAPWLYRIATNRALTLLKKRSKQRQLFQQADLSQTKHNAQFKDQKEQSMTLEDRYAVRELLCEALSRLAEEDAVCLVLRFVINDRYSEIATTLGVTKEAVRKRVARALVTLRSVYRNLDQEVSL